MPCSTRLATWRSQTPISCWNQLKPASSLGIKTPLPYTCATWILDPGPPGRSPASEALLPTHPTPSPKNLPGQSLTPSLQRLLRQVSSYSGIAWTTFPSRASEPAEPPLSTTPTATPHHTTDLTTAGPNG